MPSMLPLSYAQGDPMMGVIYTVSTFARITEIPYFVQKDSQHF
jgi:hypothetical protein